MNLLKLISVMAFAALTFVSATAPSKAQVNHCYTVEEVTKMGDSAGFTTHIELTGQALSQFLDAYAKAAGITRADIIQLDAVVIFHNPALADKIAILQYFAGGCQVAQEQMDDGDLARIYKILQEMRAGQ